MLRRRNDLSASRNGHFPVCSFIRFARVVLVGALRFARNDSLIRACRGEEGGRVAKSVSLCFFFCSDGALGPETPDFII